LGHPQCPKVAPIQRSKDNGNADHHTEADQQPDRQTIHDRGIHRVAPKTVGTIKNTQPVD
jgi:hypothetical protein